MYIGNDSHRNVPGCHDYASAQRTLEVAREQAGRFGSEETGWPLAAHYKSVTWVRQLPTGDIGFRLYDTQVVTWHPDNSVTIRNYGTKTTTEFADRFLPAGFRLGYETGRGGNVLIHHTAREGEDYWTRRDVCQGVAVRFRATGPTTWAPEQDDLEPMSFPVIDRKVTRALAAQYHLKDFTNWLVMAPRHVEVHHNHWSLHTCMGALAQRDFRKAAEHLPVINKDGNAFGRTDFAELPIVMLSWRDCITMTSVDKLKLAIWHVAGAVSVETFTTMSVGELERRMVTVRKLRQLDISGSHSYGPRT